MHKLLIPASFSILLAAAPPALAQSAAPSDASAVAAACGGELQEAAFNALPAAKQREKLGCFTREAAKIFNKTLPSKIDDATTLQKVSADGTMLTYRYSVNILKSELRPEVLDAFKPSVTEKVCAASDMKLIIRIGGSYRYLWFDRNNELMGELIVSEC